MKRRILCAALALMLLSGMCLPALGADLQLAAPSAVLLDAATGTVLYESNAHERLAPASVTKVMTMLLVMEAIDGGKIAWGGYGHCLGGCGGKGRQPDLSEGGRDDERFGYAEVRGGVLRQ